MEEGKAVVTGKRTIVCCHCQAVCPTDAISVTGLDPEALSFSTLHFDNHWLPYGGFDVELLVRLMHSRRSCRMYQEKQVEKNLLEDLVRIGTTAPSGTNSQSWTFTILSSRKEVIRLGGEIAEYFGRVNRTAEKSWLRWILSCVGKPELATYYHRYYPSVKRSLDEWRETGRDRLFHGAPATILIGGRNDASCPMEDALLATQNILLAAHAMGLGTCLIGYAVEALKRDPGINTLLGIPDDEKVYSVIALGYPAVKYQKVTGRKKTTVRYPFSDTS